MYAIYIVIRRTPQRSLARVRCRQAGAAERPRVRRATWCRRLIAFSAVGAIFVGVAMLTEAASLGALGEPIVVAPRRAFTWKMFWDSISGTLQISSALMLVIAGSQAFGSVLAFRRRARTGATAAATASIADHGDGRYADACCSLVASWA